jgi:hypothetical protein
MKAYSGSGSIALRILGLGTRWMWMISFTPRPLYPQGKSSWYALDRRLGWPQSRSGRGGEEKNFQPLPGLEPPIIQPIAQSYTTKRSVFYGVNLCLIQWTVNVYWCLKNSLFHEKRYREPAVISLNVLMRHELLCFINTHTALWKLLPSCTNLLLLLNTH